jgi:hypothetical protein
MEISGPGSRLSSSSQSWIFSSVDSVFPAALNAVSKFYCYKPSCSKIPHLLEHVLNFEEDFFFFHFSNFGQDYPTPGLTVTRLLKVYCTLEMIIDWL